MKGLQTIPSESSVEQTTDNLIGNIEDQGWHLFARINHAAQAKGKGLELRPTEVVLFGNPEVGTLLMQDRQTAAIDLPVKALVCKGSSARIDSVSAGPPEGADGFARTRRCRPSTGNEPAFGPAP